MTVRIRPAVGDDGPVLRQIERRAGERFRTVGLAEVADHEPFSLEELAAWAAAGRSWVAVDATDHPIGYVVVDVVDGAAHIEQISVDPDHQGSGVGRALIARVGDWARDTDRECITLTTFSDVAWNGPLYQRLGFAPIPDDDLGPELRAVRDTETAHGLDPGRRVCLRLDLHPPPANG